MQCLVSLRNRPSVATLTGVWPGEPVAFQWDLVYGANQKVSANTIRLGKTCCGTGLPIDVDEFAAGARFAQSLAARSHSDGWSCEVTSVGRPLQDLLLLSPAYRSMTQATCIGRYRTFMPTVFMAFLRTKAGKGQGGPVVDRWLT